MNISRFTFCILLGATIGLTGCATLKLVTEARTTSKPVPDPLAGWTRAYNRQPNELIVKDYQDYIQNLPPEERENADFIQLFKDGTGQHAIKIIVPIKGTEWDHVLIYDKGNKRIKAIKYASGNYRS